MPTKAKRLTSTALIFILIIPLFTVLNPSIPEVKALPLIDTIIQVREQPESTFNQDVGMVNDKICNMNEVCIRAATGGAGTGYVIMFLTMRSNFIHEKRLNVTTRSTFAAYTAIIQIHDGIYDRTDDTDWVTAACTSPFTPKGGGLLQNIRGGGAWGVGGPPNKVNDSVIVDTSAGTETFVTLAFWGCEGHLAFDFSIEWGSIYIHDAATNDIIWWTEMNAASYTTEKTGTNFDYGFWSPLDNPPPDFCSPIDVEILNPSAKAEDGTPWVYTESKFYFFNASYINFNLTSDEASIRFSPDSITNVTVTYSWLNDINGLLSVTDPADFVTVPTVARNFTGALYNSTTGDLWVIFPIWFTNNSPDAQYVDVYLACSPFIDILEDFHIYNQGGLVERDPPTGNGTWTEGGEWFEGCVYANGSLTATQTFRKLQQVRYEYALRFYENVSGTWIPEDQFMQTFQHSGGGAEKYGGIFEWILRWRIYGFDNTTDTWAELLQVSMWMSDGDEGADDEWIAIATEIVGNSTALSAKNWNSFIEEEPAARTRHWVDIWINKINASSMIASRTNAYYFGMERSAYLRWQPFFLIGADTWAPMLDNSTEAIAFVPIAINNTEVVQARVFDLMKIEIEFDMEVDAVPASSDPYRVCIEDVNVNEVLLQDRGSFLEGINTPIFIETKVPDMPIGGLLGGLWQAITALGETLWSALSGVLGIAWDAIAQQFPWFTQFMEDTYSLVIAFTQFLETIVSSLVELLNFIAGLFWLFPVITGAIGDTWALITTWLDPFVANASDWILLAVIVFGIIPFAANLSEGRIKEVRADIETVWGFLSTILDWAFRLAKMVIDIILGFIPG